MAPDKIGFTIMSDTVAELELAPTIGAFLHITPVVMEVTGLIFPTTITLVVARLIRDHTGIPAKNNVIPYDISKLRVVATVRLLHILIAVFAF